MKTWQALLFLCLIWASIYLTHLGAQELRGEEARRIIPAQEMLTSGDWIVPRIAGEVYSNKPPLINWMIATSFHLTGIQNEFTARLPSALCLLALGIAAFFLFRKTFGPERATYVGLILFTSIAMIDKCRMAEIEAVYIALFGVACFVWIRLWIAEASPWLTWTLPYFFLGMGWLAKGPVHLLFWALFLGFTLRFARKSREAFHPSHLLGIGIMTLLFLPWMTSNIDAVGSPDESMGTWVEQLRMRADFSNIDFVEWAKHPFEILINFLPWTVPLGFALWKLRKSGDTWDSESRFDSVVRGSLYASIAGCLLICLLPGGLPRYIMPLYTLTAFSLVGVFFRMQKSDQDRYEVFARRTLFLMIPVFLGIAIVGTGLAIHQKLSVNWAIAVSGIALLVAVGIWLRKHGGTHSYFLSSSFVLAAGAVAMFGAIVPHQVADGTMRKVAGELRDRSESENRQLVIFADELFRSSYTKELRLFFYLRPGLIAVGENSDLPQERILVLGRPKLERNLRKRKRSFHIVEREFIDVDGKPLSLLSMDPRE
ncbi:MAG: glycosyltransferase family 39 protein [Verrucomicrobiales bacterium]|nr:glycosyltransferase family 39 protein [Verrucomicrobiales bacterium]